MPTIYESKAGTYHRTQRDAGPGFTTLEIGTDKESIIAALTRARREGRASAAGRAAIPLEPAQLPAPEPTPAAPCSSDPGPYDPTRKAADGFPDHRPGVTGSQIRAMFAPRPPEIQDLCHRISKLRGIELGAVAFEVSARLAEQAPV